MTEEDHQIPDENLDFVQFNSIQLQPSKKLSLTKLNFKHISDFTNDSHIRDKYNCALIDNILLQGILYLADHQLIFRSEFNRFNLLFGKTNILIPANEILRVQKCHNLKIFDNSIKITTTNGKITFTSFISRDRAFDALLMLYNPKNQNDIQNPISLSNIQSQDSEQSEEQLMLLQKRQDQIINISKLLNQPIANSIVQSTFQYKNIDLRDIFRIIYSDDFPIENFKNFWEYYKQGLSGDYQYKSSIWEPSPPKMFMGSNDIQEFLQSPLYSEKINNFIHPLGKSVPMMPSEAATNEKIRIYWVSQDFLIVDIEIRISKVLYCDYYYLSIRSSYKFIGDSIQFESILIYNPVQSTFMEGVIKKESLNQTLNSLNEKFLPAAHKYLQFYLEQDKDYIDKYKRKSLLRQQSSILMKSESYIENEKGELNSNKQVAKKLVNFLPFILLVSLILLNYLQNYFN